MDLYPENGVEIPTQIKKALDDWAEKGWLPGDFCQAVLRNDLVDACCRADRESLEAIKQIALYVFNDLPGPCWGSQEAMNEWVKNFEKTTEIPAS